MYVVCFLVLYEWEPGQHFDTDIGAVDVVVVVIDDEGTAVVVVEAVEAVEAVEVEKMIWLSAVIVSIDRLSGRQPACKNSDVGSPKVCITKGIEQWIDGWIDVAKVVGNHPQGIGDVGSGVFFPQNTIEYGQDAVR